jgi:hypothetical protein
MTFYKRQSYSDGKKIKGSQGLGEGKNRKSTGEFLEQ